MTASTPVCFSIACVIVLCTLAAGDKFVCMRVDDPRASGNYTPCLDGTRNAVSKMQAIDTAFGRSNVTDVVFLMDRSKSISSTEFDIAKNTVKTLMDYLMLRRLVYLHPDYTRVSVASFGEQSMVEFDGINTSPSVVQACNVNDKLDNIKHGTKGATNMNSALEVRIPCICI